jgi:hypothetical protein
VHSFNSDSLAAQNVFWIASPSADDQSGNAAAGAQKAEFTIAELAKEFGLTLRALRFYHSRGLAEISQMIEAQAGRANAHTLKLTAEKCLEQIAFFERQMREAAEALTELREIHLALSRQPMQREPKA